MKISGIIVEYNPLHNGHLFHINKTKELTNSDLVIAVMSGNFNQRGIPSIIDKWTKTKLALENGVDIVFELPAVYALSSAEFFSHGAVSLLNSLGVVDSICFGSEAGDITLLETIAEVLVHEPEEYKQLLKNELNKGLLFPKARSLALIEYLNTKTNYDRNYLSEQLNSSNNILGIEYIKSLKRLNSSIKPYTIKRLGGSYNSKDLNNIFSSATSIRKALNNNEDILNLKHHVPESVLQELLTLEKNNYTFTFENMMYPYIKYKALSSRHNLFENLPDASEGLHNKLLSALENSTSYNECISATKSKRYTYTRISRILCQYYLDFQHYDIVNMRKAPCPYARILGFTATGATALKSIKDNCSIPLYSKLPKDTTPTLNLDLQCTRSYSILNPSIRFNEDRLRSPIIRWHREFSTINGAFKNTSLIYLEKFK